MTQAICIPIFEGLMELWSLQECPKHLVPNSVLAESSYGTDVYDVRWSATGLGGEGLTNSSNWYQL